MKDLIERLREHGNYGAGTTNQAMNLCNEAADRITELEAKIEEMTPKFVAYEYLVSPAGEEMAWEENARLRARIAALEAEASEGERRGLERGVSVASSWKRLTPIERQSVCAHFGWTERDFEVAVNVANGIADTIHALIPEAPAREGE